MTGHDISQIKVGDEINGYRIESLLGQGGMGVVYVVSHPESTQRFALKTLLDREPEKVVYFEREWQALKGLARHPNVVEAYDSGKWERVGAPYIVMELLKGRSLDDHVQANGPFDLNSLPVLFGMLAAGMDHVHSHNVFHRDIKPANLFLEELDDGTLNLKLIDFGIAKLRAGRGSVLLGTEFYGAPEQFVHGGSVSAATDVFPLAALVYFALTGLDYKSEPDHQAQRASELLRRRGIPLHRSFDTWFRTCREHEPSRRFQSVGAAVQSLTDCFSRSSATTVNWIGPKSEGLEFRKAGFWGGELTPKPIAAPNGCHECKFVAIRCPACRHRIDSPTASCSSHDYCGAPPFADLLYCPICGTQVRKPGRNAFLAEVQKDSDERRRSTRQRCYSEDSKYCIRTGAELRFEPRLDFETTRPDAAMSEGQDTLVISGRDVVVKYDNVEYDSTSWPLKHWIGNSPKTTRVPCAGDTCCVRIPATYSWDFWYFETEPPPGHSSPEATTSTRMHLAPLPTVTLIAGREVIPLHGADKVVHYGHDAPWLELRVQLAQPPHWVPAELVEVLLERIQVDTGEQLLPMVIAGHDPRQLDLVARLRPGEGATLTLLPWGLELPVLKPVRRAASLLQLDWQDCRGEWFRLDEHSPIMHVYQKDTVARAGWRGPERYQFILRLVPQNPAEDLPAGELEARFEKGGSLAPETVERQARLATWRLTLPPELLPTARGGRLFIDVAFGTAFRSRFFLEPVAASLGVVPDGPFDMAADSEGQVWWASGGLERLRVRAVPQLAQPDVGRVTIDRHSLDVRLTDSVITLPYSVPVRSNTAVRIELFHRRGLAPVWRDLVLEPFPDDFDLLVHQWGEPPELRMTSADLDVGVVSRPNLAVDRLVRASIHVLNHWEDQVIIAAQTFQAESGRFEVRVPEVYTIGPKSSASVVVLLKPLVTSDRAHWQFALRLQYPHAAKIDCEVVVEAVMEKHLSDRIYYDYGTSNTAVCGNYARRRNYLKEATESHFVRSRAVALWDPLSGGAEPMALEAPCDDVRLMPATDGTSLPHAVLSDIKTHFRRGQSPVVPIRTSPERGRRRLYQPREITETFASVQESLARFVMSRLSTVPSEVITALPIVLRGARRAAAREAIQAAFSKACREDRHPEPSIDATLDESTAAAMTTLLGRIDVPTNREEHVVVIDVGGGTTDITFYRIAQVEGGGGRVVECIGFDGLGVGGSWVTERVARIFRDKIERVAGEARQVVVRIPLPGERLTPAGGPGKEGAVVNETLLTNLAEQAKKVAVSTGAWQAKQADLQPLAAITGVGTGGQVFPVEVRALDLTYDELLNDPGYAWLIEEIAIRAENAANLSQARDYQCPQVERVVLAGQASVCKKMQSTVIRRLKATGIAEFAANGEAHSKDRKLAVLEGLRAYCERVRGTDLQSRFRVAGLDNVVMCPVGNQGWQKVVLPRYYPLNVPATFCDEADVIEFGGTGRRQILPVILRRPGGPSTEEIPTTQAVRFLAQSVTLLWDYGLGDRENRELRRRYRYCVWVDARDDLKGAMFEHWDSGLPIRGVGQVQCERHPIVLLLSQFVARFGEEAKLLDLNALSRGSTPIVLTDSEGVEWTTYGIPTGHFRDRTSPWYDPHFVVGRGEQQFVLAAKRGERFTSIPIATGTPNQHTTYVQLARDLVDRVSGRRIANFPVVCGVKLPKQGDQTLVVAIALGEVDAAGSPLTGAPAWCESTFAFDSRPPRTPAASQWWAPCLNSAGAESEMHEFAGYRQEVTRIGLDGHDSFDETTENQLARRATSSVESVGD